MVGGLGGGGKGRKGPGGGGPGDGSGGGPYGGGGPLMRPSSVGDFNEVDEDGWNIAQMSDQEVLAEFDRMLENMNLSEEKKEPLNHLPLSKKREMLSMHSRNQARTQFHSPADYIQYLSNPVRILTLVIHMWYLIVNRFFS